MLRIALKCHTKRHTQSSQRLSHRETWPLEIFFLSEEIIQDSATSPGFLIPIADVRSRRALTGSTSAGCQTTEGGLVVEDYSEFLICKIPP
jgi:hypothetical protein